MTYLEEANIKVEDVSLLDTYHKKGQVEKMKLILELRISGQTLQQVGLRFSVTRERIRQLEAKAIEIIRQAKKKHIHITSS